jgi:diacylglycerol diphosphate phosphatase / phosphatidate phosphatase
MGFFSRRQREGQNGHHMKDHGGNRNIDNTYTMSHRPSFGQWLKATWLDILTFVIMGVIGLGVCRPRLATTIAILYRY